MLKKWNIIAFVLITCLLTFTTTGIGNPTATEGDFYVSSTGNDQQPGTIDKPFATIERARMAVLELKKTTQNDITVLIRGGTYYLENPLHFSKDDSGTDAQKITYKAYGSEMPEFIGGIKLTNWTVYRDNIFVTDIPQGINPRQLFEANNRLTLAREPNNSYLKLEKPVEGLARKSFIYRDNDLNLDQWDVSEGHVYIWPGHNWFSQDKPIAAVDITNRQITMTDNRGYDMNPGNRFYLKNILDALDMPGECFISLKQRKVYTWPSGGLDNIIAPAVSCVLLVQGERDKPIRNLHFEGINIGISNEDTVRFINTENCSLRYCLIENAFRTGIEIGQHGQKNIIYGNEIRSHGESGLFLSGYTYGQPDENNNNIIENNHIHHCGRLVGHGQGVQVAQSGYNKIIHNHVHDMPRYGISVNGLRYQLLREQLKQVTWENHYDYLHSRNNLVAYNRIHDTNQDSQDTGAIESWGPGRDNVYDHNLIYNTGNEDFDLQSGIYIDDAGDHFTVTNNIIYGVIGTHGNQGIYVKGVGNVIDNNVLIGNPKCTTGIRSFFMADERCDHHTYTRNIIYFPSGPTPIGSFNQTLSAVHDAGTTASWNINVSQGGEYVVWVRYAAYNTPYNLKSMSGRTSLAIDSNDGVRLKNLDDTGAWDKQHWVRSATIELGKGAHNLKWENIDGGGINLDAFVFCNNKSWTPGNLHETNQPDNTHDEIIIVQAESYLTLNGKGKSVFVYDFDNWSEDRVSQAEYNLFWAIGSELSIEGSPAHGSLKQWQTLQSNKFDQHSIIADPLFVDPANNDYRLKPDSPALKLGIKSIDTSSIGLLNDFPMRLARE